MQGQSRSFFFQEARQLCGDRCPGLPFTARLQDVRPLLREEMMKASEGAAEAIGKKWVLKSNELHQGAHKYFLDTKGLLNFIDFGKLPEAIAHSDRLSGSASASRQFKQQSLTLCAGIGTIEERSEMAEFSWEKKKSLIVQEFVNQHTLEDRNYHVRFFGVAFNYPCNNGNEETLYRRPTFDDFFAIPEIKQNAKNIRAGVEAAFVHSVLAVSDYYGRFHTAEGGSEEAASKKYGIWFLDFLIEKWRATHLRMWQGIFRLMGMGVGVGAERIGGRGEGDGKEGGQNDDPTSQVLRDRLEAVNAPRAAVAYEAWVSRSLGTNFRPVWPPDSDAASRWLSVWEEGTEEMHEATGAESLLESLTTTGPSRGMSEWPEGADRRELQEKMGIRGGKKKEGSLRRWVEQKERAGGLEAFLELLETTGGYSEKESGLEREKESVTRAGTPAESDGTCLKTNGGSHRHTGASESFPEFERLDDVFDASYVVKYE
uniref:Uncharacterized protein n=1 Tax=Chromera velia CCMP2878 TaxID=1169474 RepID=A0A0G4F099_9ALVE|eukprot:Cvel_14419.t1-p1 / transcript=Cvel_14419.t1 / gene=Cvel_14419 / organism=Chromera_velia_CCMP2878 / gene_product=hypothetical protein / transcript_product=hypothetical protein / location=Cvel_scaffold1025:26820-32771(+) / protein_length=485 / sequence_SO=supercontig / SO=protein_coding / is_pseudo=false